MVLGLRIIENVSCSDYQGQNSLWGMSQCNFTNNALTPLCTLIYSKQLGHIDQHAPMFVGVWLGAAGRRTMVSIWRQLRPTLATPPLLSGAAIDRRRTLLGAYHWRRRQRRAAVVDRLLRRMRPQPLSPLYRESSSSDCLASLCFFSARGEPRKVLFLALSVTFLFVYEIFRESLNGLHQIHKENVFGPSLGRVWMRTSKVKDQGHQRQKRRFSALSAARVRFMFGKHLLPL